MKKDSKFLVSDSACDDNLNDLRDFLRSLVQSKDYREDKFMKKEPKYFSFSEALIFLKKGYKLSRIGWNGKNQYIQIIRELQYKNSEGETIYNNDGVIAFYGTSGIQMGWCCWQTDMLANDWYIFNWKECDI